MELKTTQNFRQNTPLTKNMTCAPYQHFSTILFLFHLGKCPAIFLTITVQKKMTKIILERYGSPITQQRPICFLQNVPQNDFVSNPG